METSQPTAPQVTFRMRVYIADSRIVLVAICSVVCDIEIIGLEIRDESYAVDIHSSQMEDPLLCEIIIRKCRPVTSGVKPADTCQWTDR